MRQDLSDVTIVTVSFNSAAVLGNMLASVPDVCPVVIVDNGSADMEQIRNLAKRPHGKLIENGQNLGFGRACNTGAAAATTQFILFLNPDTVLGEKTLEILLAAAAQHPEAGAFNPRILDDTGDRVLKRKSDLIPRSEHMPRGGPPAGGELAILTGAAIFMRKRDFDKIGGFDPAIFLFYEDDDLAVRLRQNTCPLILVDDARVSHIGGGSSSGPRIAVERLKAWHMGWSRLYTMRKHHRPLARSRAVGHALARIISPAMLFSRLRFVKRTAFLRGTLAALFSRPSH
ncbi:glycosyltransferase family 2 protein [Pelagivirga sediminicola]|uniref:Glycosyltransferase family 2 protein n=1 Tax=Pelagivirga sediminicola TaxID=2170575 RepID=A0A2T7G5X9_9RHOB|nr:glycosyltransferase family 2 protein [Pelagivirga sediminicola]PVA09777.1 glycosyltransferase family 2 protein [Pelagivirga sediminicola]